MIFYEDEKEKKEKNPDVMLYWAQNLSYYTPLELLGNCLAFFVVFVTRPVIFLTHSTRPVESPVQLWTGSKTL